MIQKKIISATEAGISNDHISKKALQVVQTLQEAGFQAYLVGGCVRDLIIGTKPKDFDVSTNATPEQIKKTFGRNGRIIGRRFKLVHVRFGYEVIEVATFRADASDRAQVGSNEMSEGDQGQLLRDNVYGSMEEDVVRRDFTVNAMYYDSVNGEIIDFMNGYEDVKAGKLKSIGEPELRFTEDPVRMLRVIRFAAKLGFEMESSALTMIEEQGKLLSHVSNARLFEEVLKLFHGGAAYDSYLLLRKYGLFKYLFPFTDQMVVDGVDGLPERALKNTDKRVRQGKPVIPAFLFACMMWDPVQADAQVLLDDGANESHAWRVAMNDGLRDQNQYVAVPRRLADIVLDIWNIHFRLIKRNPRMVKASLNNRRFRAAYDFLLLRTMMHEVDEEIGEWWTEIQEVDVDERDAMIDALSETYKKDRRQPKRFQGGEPDGNSVNYNSPNYDDNHGNSYTLESYDNVAKPQQRSSSRHNSNGGRAATNNDRRGRQTGGRNTNARKKVNGQSVNSRSPNRTPNQNRNANESYAGNGEANHAGRGNTGKKRSSKKRVANHGQQRRSNPANARNARGRTAQEPRFQEARPADEYGVTSNGSNKKVKVRRKRKIAGADIDKPIF